MSEFKVGDIVVCDDAWNTDKIGRVIEVLEEFHNLCFAYWVSFDSKVFEDSTDCAVFYDNEMRLATELEKALYV